ncbi:MAG: phosphatase PAP2 family protein [bacterium]|nr:phosphatase PAP2 family protein [bacterium]
MTQFDIFLAEKIAAFLGDFTRLQAFLVGLAESNFTKALLFTPFFIYAWFRQDDRARIKILAAIVSCAAALIPVWIISSTWPVPKPIHPDSASLKMSQVFFHYFASKPVYLQWGSFPSDHAAFLTAFSLGLFSLNKKIGLSAFFLAVLCNGFFRIATGLHYVSDIAAGILIGFLAHLLIFSLLKRNFFSKILSTVQSMIGYHWVGEMLFMGFLVEMSVLFRDIRFLDPYIFGPFAPW